MSREFWNSARKESSGMEILSLYPANQVACASVESKSENSPAALLAVVAINSPKAAQAWNHVFLSNILRYPKEQYFV